MSKTDPKDDEKKQEFFSLMDEYFSIKKAEFDKQKKEKKTDSSNFFGWLFGE